MRLVIVYNFFEEPTLGVYLGESVLCSLESDGSLGKYYKKATPTTLNGLASVVYDATPHEKLIKLCEELSEGVLAKKFKPKGKRKVDFGVIAKDPKVKILCIKHISKQVDLLVRTCQEESYPITFNLTRKATAEDFRYVFASEPFVPKMMFEQGADGIAYTLAFDYKGQAVYPCQHQTTILCNKPGWITIGNRLVSTGELNGNKLKPFLKKATIQIPARTTRDYFEKFVMDLVPKFKITTIGFVIDKKQRILRKELKLVENLFSGEWQLRLLFHYEAYTFAYGSQLISKTLISFGDNDSIIIIQQERDQVEEAETANKLNVLGLSLTDTGTFSTEPASKAQLITWLQNNQEQLVSFCDIKLEQLRFGDKQISLASSSIKVNYLKENDWFDVEGYVRVGVQDIAFKDLIQHIRDENQFYLLDDGSYFVIPEEWMTKYSSLAKYGQHDKGRFKLAKSHLGLIEETGEEVSGDGVKIMEVEDAENIYEPSSQLIATLRPYQLEGVRWLRKLRYNGLGACLADDMGLGKTLQVIAGLLAEKEALSSEELIGEDAGQDSGQLSIFGNTSSDSAKLRALVVVPASLVFNWKAELVKFAPSLMTTSYVGAGRKSRGVLLELFDVVITTYQTALRDHDILKAIDWRYIVLDESQYIKNRNSKVFKALSELPAEGKISLSGTPIENSLSDLWSQMEFINPAILGSFDFFKKNFKVPIEKNADEAATAELRKIISPFLLRRTKEEVAPELPAKVEQILVVEMTVEQKKLFEKQKSAARNLILNLDEGDNKFHIHVFKEILALRQIANHPVLFDKDFEGSSGKVDLVTNKLIELVRSGKKILVFSSFTSLLDLVAKDLEAQAVKFITLTGKTSQKEREKAVKQFQESSETQVFLISIKAGGTGLNLTEAEYVFILDPWWNPFVEEQAIARAHRIGQTKQVHIIKFISKDSIEEKIQVLQAKKMKLNADILASAESIVKDREGVLELLS